METATIGQGGGRKLTNYQKVEIAIQKELRPTPTSTNVNIAAQFGVSKDLVNRISVDSLNPEQKRIYEQRISALKSDAIDVVYEGLQKSKTLINKADSANHLAGVTASIGKAYEIYRIETNQSTSNVAVLDVAQTINQTLQIAVKLHRADHNEPLPTKTEIVDSFVHLCARNGVQPDESLIDFSLLDGVENPQD